MKKLLLTSLWLSYASIAQAQSLDARACNPDATRQTILYVDNSYMVNSNTSWMQNTIQQIASSMMSGEKLSIIDLDPINRTSKLLWVKCWSESSDALRSLFSTESLNVLYSLHAQYAKSQVSLNQQKSILVALASDIIRFRVSTPNTIRTLIYSDMIEISEYGSAFSKSKPASKLNDYFKSAVFYIFGIGEYTVSRDVVDNIKNYWQSDLKDRGAVVAQIDRILSIPTLPPIKSFYYNVQINFQGHKLLGKMSLFVNKDNVLQDSWIGVSGLSVAGIKGNYACVENTCVINGVILSGLLSYGQTELLKMNGNTLNLKGTIQVTNNLVFEINASTDKILP